MGEHLAEQAAPALDPASLDILELMVLGKPQRMIARKLVLSLRTVEAHAAKVRDALVAGTRYATGVHAIRGGHVDPGVVIVHARGSVGDDRTTPTARQRDLMQLFAAGASDEDAAACLGASLSTVRREIRALASANGAATRLAAGALFEAHGWNEAAHRGAAAAARWASSAAAATCRTGPGAPLIA